MKYVSACACALLACASAAGADRFGGVREAIRARMVEHTVPGVAIAVWKDGEVLWEEGFGWADVENRIPASGHTMFNLASLSKTFTAVGLMTLVQAGKVDLDQPANLSMAEC
ncbi:serine hydrolase domain-containing protein [Peristeroidobacter soli]|uniref:serine hydrolase domain-containing protein n=1 Tax=Peristeroidobacter soli TaxID=2497877 RepID=UPI00130041FA|nr:serine hydrolase domain-containing protein [Peristeroidobacter soli]